MPDEIKEYNHLIEIDEEKKRVVISRISPGSHKRHLFTSVDLPQQTLSQNPDAFRDFARLLGENILFDSPIARRILDL